MLFQQERQEAQKLFATENGQPAEAPAPPPAKTFTPGEIPSDDILEDSPAQLEELPRKGPTPEQIIAIKVLHFNIMLVLFSFRIIWNCPVFNPRLMQVRQSTSSSS